MAQDSTKWIPNTHQRRIAQILADPDDFDPITAKCKKAHVPRRTLYNWLADPRFLDYLQTLIDRYADSELSNVWRALIQQAKKGNVNAIKLYFELKGKYKQEVELTGGLSIVDLFRRKTS